MKRCSYHSKVELVPIVHIDIKTLPSGCPLEHCVVSFTAGECQGGEGFDPLRRVIVSAGILVAGHEQDWEVSPVLDGAYEPPILVILQGFLGFG